MKFFWILLLMLLVARTGCGRDLTLDQALRLAENHSYRLKQARAGAQVAESGTSIARSERLPTLSASASARYTNEVAALTVGLMPGTTFRRELGTNETYQTDLTLTLPLYTGGRISSAIDLADANLAYWEALEQIDRDRLYYQTRLDYLGLQLAAAQRHTAQSSLKRMQVIHGDVSNRFKSGVADSVDLLESRLALTRAEFAVTRADLNSRSRQIQLLTRLGLDPSEEINPVDTLPEPSPIMGLPETGGSRPELAAATASIGMRQAQVNLEKAEYFPTLSGYTGYSYGKPGYDMFANEWKDNITVGAQLNWSFNLGNKTGARKRSALQNLEASRHYREDVNETLNRDVRLATEQLHLAYEKHASTSDQHSLTVRSYQLAQVQHREGALSANRLLEIEAVLTESEFALVAARVDFYLAQSRYFYTVGSEKLREGI